ncbi:L-alanine exporter AlaE [Pelagovum pacificum]|uniref:L-alanine exporter AlaE n=1 Tax=Pelagovum pacificum TaxID=2588711 RepID=A0A5C5GEX8_9RHOB|nr:L-alanine exporter AlaE [Pelagovum pacificum]QQA43541.1 L-alanine exporter AlaE [Pelagovum pacificum]TNY33322.1 L-alanine exporter AlaE [Pelagovum pacificum]
MRVFIIDTIATIAFFTVVATFSELVIAGMDTSEVLTTRLVMVPVMIVTGRPYTRWRDWLFARVQPRGRLSAALTDIAAFLAFQVPVYGTTLMIAGASAAEALVAIGSAATFMILLARPFGLFVELVRRISGVEPA